MDHQHAQIAVAAFADAVYGSANGLLSEVEAAIFEDEVDHLKGRKFFVPGRPRRFEIDGPALLGAALGAERQGDAADQEWLRQLLEQSSGEVAGDEWQSGFVRAASLCTGEQNLRFVPPDLSVAPFAKGIGEMNTQGPATAWELATNLRPHQCGPERDAVQLVAFDYILKRRGQ